VTASYDNVLVLLSVVVATMASYTALDLAGRVTHSGGRSATLWLLGGSAAMGAGIWSMHFIGMLAFELPIPIFFDGWITAASLLIAIVTSGYALSVASRRSLGAGSLAGAGVIMGGGIAAMHYTGMAAMRMSPPISYDPVLFAASIAIAMAAATAALWLAFIYRSAVSGRAVFGKSVAALVMGCAIAGMHYTGMAAAGFADGSVCLATGRLGLSPEGLAAALGAVILSILVATLTASSLDRRIASRSAQMLAEVEQANAALREAQISLRESEERFRSAFDSATIGMGLVSMQGRWLRVNSSLCRIFGYPEPELLSADYQSIAHPEDLQADTEQARRLANGELQSYQMEKRYFHREGHIVWVNLSASVVKDVDGAPRHFVVQIEDISARKQAEEALQSMLREQALRDPLTALFNRRHLEDAVERELARARRNDEPLAIVMVDIDHFKSINDRYGHACGDAVIRRVAQLLVDGVRRSDIACRYGGEEFLLLLPGAPASRALEVAGAIRDSARAVRHQCEGRDIGAVTVSCGVALFPQHGESAEQVMKGADRALYQAKQQGRDTVVLAADPA
jgi:diguanylate cyclase (GGDEF)-like protein/PAS domain S-box-containing protein